MKQIARLLFGPHRSRQSSRSAQTYAAKLEGQLAAFDSRFNGTSAPQAPDVPFCDSPIFILSAGWRSGSTLLQRMVMANNPAIVIWGEPYDIAAPIQTLADQLRPFSSDWPPAGYFFEARESDLSNQWVANLYPPAQAFRAAHLAYMEALFAGPAQALDLRQWGLKEVRFGADHVRYLHWLYPKAKFIFLVRNPLDAYKSYRSKLTWFAEWPGKMVATPFGFGAQWRRLCRDFLEMQKQDIGLLLHYESLGDEQILSKLSDYLGWTVPSLQEMSKIRGWKDDPGSRLGGIERAMLRHGTGKIANELGYG
ncbi:sulfotransferase [Pelagibius litoralis]|uniref:Sulfotransferase n=1 Tax=Pelagibius litoralis TaxID=374515 RepID=A0A967CBQ2_9PROT|nr:sulfotransferase [Pelagibius litoralis]NIA68518.1 sulfotransferase [Pelagibius litoralis]